ncbi:lipocalin family protein [Ketobacter alkanivorans]|uniref:Outer membrane lipoprotein Blc n=1 Tax=Ketobacter alkanivorans TaxID=1917421 RepID=A0A2K9LH90_9GAMM|nr:lipocalin family protein [Ketobacter alkanivorans]AUM11521.1 hypothetical protein Kalk_03400 [Ketobacter alkanivorans]MCP5018358.1 lipocalin family protein [Ketobacter sp.]
MTMHKIKTTLLLLGAVFLSACAKIETVPYVEVERYMGVWYQISAYETNFNEGLVGVTAEYTLLADGSVQVYNKGYLDTLDGPLDEILGNAVVVDEETNSRLKVSFPGVPNFPWANYLIVILDEEDYQYAVVTDPLKYTLFVLNRTPQMEAGLYSEILTQLDEMGIDTEKLLLTPQPEF